MPPIYRIKKHVLIDEELLGTVLELAEQEHEGNFSRMVRELIKEALETRRKARERAERRRAA